jgi:hypothetical protein
MENSLSYYRNILLQEIEEVSYKKSGLENPDKADRNKDHDISSWEKKVGTAIEKNMEEGEKGEYKLSLEQKIVERFLKKLADRFQYSTKDAARFVKDTISKMKLDVEPMSESQDHEVSMANNSLETIIKAAMELKAKMGNQEKDIPAWIQDHITNAANFITQASENYHEYSNGHDQEDQPEQDNVTSLFEILKSKKK